MARILESSFDRKRQQYHLIEWTGNAPHQRWFDSYGDMVEAFEQANPREPLFGYRDQRTEDDYL